VPAAANCDPAGVASHPPDPEAPRFARGTPEFDRALAFFDGTYAVALTLLVTALDGTDVPGAWADLAALWAAIGSRWRRPSSPAMCGDLFDGGGDVPAGVAERADRRAAVTPADETRADAPARPSGGLLRLDPAGVPGLLSRRPAAWLALVVLNPAVGVPVRRRAPRV
jgi:hypothetical protein